MKTKFYSIKTCFLLAFLAMGIARSANAQTIEKSVLNWSTGGSGSTVSRGDILIYTIKVTCGPQEVLFSAMLYDPIPAGTSYVPGSTTLNGVAMPDVNGAMPFTTGVGQINSQGSQTGICDRNTVTTVTFKVKVDAGSGTITNVARVAGTDPSLHVYDRLTNEVLSNINPYQGCDIVYMTSASGTSYNMLREMIKTTGLGGPVRYFGQTGPCEDIMGNALISGSLFTNVAAMALSLDGRYMYFVNNNATTRQRLGYFDLARTPLVAVTYSLPLETTIGAGYNITRMTTGTNGSFYALTDNGQDLINFSINASNIPVIFRLGALINDASNGTHDVLTETDGDIISDGTGKLYLITGANNVYTIDPLTRITKFIGAVSGINKLANEVTSSAALTTDGKLYVGGSYIGLYEVSLANFTATLMGTSGSGANSADFATCGTPIHPLRVAANEKPNPVIATANEVYAKVQPNPFHNQLNLQVQLNTSEQVRVQLIDLFGRTVYTTTEKTTAGVNSLRLPVPANLDAGVYVVELWAGDKRLLQKKIVKQ